MPSVVRHEAIRFGILEGFGLLRVRFEVSDEFRGVPFRPFEVVHTVVASVDRGRAGKV